jgi:tetratricopeptide (TPR) repeat protein
METVDLAAADAAIDGAAAVVDAGGPVASRLSWYVPLWRAMRALLEGRFDECRLRHEEALAAALRLGPDPAVELASTLQFVALRTSQDRVFELEVAVRDLVADHPDAAAARAAQASVLGLLGRDAEAGAPLAGLAAGCVAAGRTATEPGWLGTAVLLGELAATLGREAEAADLYDLLLPHARRFAVEGSGAVCHGSVSRQLGLLAHSLGRWDAADAHFADALDDNGRAGAPLLVAHTRSQWSALLRARDTGTDWETAIELLAGAEVIYRRLGVDRLADEAAGVLARSHEPAASERVARGNAFHRRDDGWAVSYGGREALVEDATGLHDLALLVANPGRRFHVADLFHGPDAVGVGHAGQPPQDGTPARGAGGGGGSVSARTLDEYRARLAELDRELAGAEVDRDPVRASLARAERDVIVAELAGPAGGPAGGEGGGRAAAADDPVERARRAVGTRIRLGIERIEAAHPSLGRHLRHSVRTGTFCAYEPEMRTTWSTPRDL